MQEKYQLILDQTKEKMKKSVESLIRDFQQIRSGRANPNLLSNIKVSYYGVDTPLNQLSSIKVVEGTQLYIKPYDKQLLKEIEKAINTSDLNLPPVNDGDGIRLQLPVLTEERRKTLTKDVDKMLEDAKIAIRNIRRESNDSIKKLEGPEDLEKSILEDIQKLTDEYIENLEKEATKKSKEIMTI